MNGWEQAWNAVDPREWGTAYADMDRLQAWENLARTMHIRGWNDAGLSRDAAGEIVQLLSLCSQREEQIEELREVLRHYTIGAAPTDDGIEIRCFVCGREWGDGESEDHAEGCLAAPRQEKQP